MGYRTQEIWLNDLSQSRNLGNIRLDEESFAIDNVTVTASAQRSEVDRKIVYPSDRQQKASANGVDLLQQLMLPRIQVDPVNNTIKVPGDGEVQMRINGVKVTAQEIRALRKSVPCGRMKSSVWNTTTTRASVTVMQKSLSITLYAVRKQEEVLV